MKADDSMRVQAVDRAMQVLAMLQDVPRTVAEISEAIGIGVSGTQKLLYTLNDHELVRRQDGRYVLAVGCAHLAQGYLSRNPLTEQSCRDLLVNLSLNTGSRVVLATLEGIAQVNLIQLDVHLGIRGDEMPLKIGPAWPQATGQILLAYATDDIVAAHLKTYPVKEGRLGVQSKSDVLRRLDAIRTTGYAEVASGEEGVKFLAVPIRSTGGNVIAALGAHITQQHKKDEQRAWVTQAAKDISGRLGFTQE